MLKKRFHLRTLMLLLSVGGILLTCGLLLSALIFFQKGDIEARLLNSNIAYARKLADTTDHYLSTAQQELIYSAGQINDFRDRARLQAEAERLRLQSGFFNSVVVVTANAVVAAASPESLKLVGVHLNSEASKQAIRTHKAFISEPYTSASGNYVVFLSQPVIAKDGTYLGYLGGTIYLKKRSMLSELLGHHFYGEDTCVSIVTGEGRIIYNSDPAAIGTLADVTPGSVARSGHAENGHFIDSQKGKRNLIGYASLQKANWKIFISGTSDNVSRILIDTVVNAFWFTLAILVMGSGMAFYFSGIISRPLEKLASYTHTTDSDKALLQLGKLKTGYQEAELLREAVSQRLMMMSRQFSLLSDAAMTDPLTGLYNRKGFSTRLQEHALTANHAVIAIDIDHFKYINDRYGHEKGDTVLVSLGKLLRANTRQHDILCRFGGEEFILFLPHSSLQEASAVAERIRTVVAGTPFPDGITITLSAGVAHLLDCGDTGELLRRADFAMYAAKKAGRDLVAVSSREGIYFCDKSTDEQVM